MIHVKGFVVGWDACAPRTLPCRPLISVTGVMLLRLFLVCKSYTRCRKTKLGTSSKKLRIMVAQKLEVIQDILSQGHIKSDYLPSTCPFKKQITIQP